MTTIEIDDIKEIRTIEADSSGRVNLGIKYADQKVKLVVVETEN